MKSNRLQDVLDNIGPGIHDVYFLDREGFRLSEQDLRELDFDNLIVVGRSEHIKSTEKMKFINLHLDVEKPSS